MDINFNGTIITLFGSLPLELLGSQGGAGLGPSRLDVFCSKKSAALDVGMCHSAEEKEMLMGSGEKRRQPPPNTLPLMVFNLLRLEFLALSPPFSNWGTWDEMRLFGASTSSSVK